MNTVKKEVALLRALAKEQREKEEIGLYAVIAERKCGKLQPEIKEHDVLKILEISKTKTNAVSLRCENRETKKIVKVNSDRFRWKIYTEAGVRTVENFVKSQYVETLNECQAKRRLDEATRIVNRDHGIAEQLASKFNEQEQMQISFVHLVLAEIAWNYLIACQNMACNARIQETKSLSRSITDFRAKYERFLYDCVDESHIDNIKRNAWELSDDDDFQKVTKEAWNAIKLMYKHKFPHEDIPYLDLRIVAQLGRMMVRAYLDSIDRTNKMLESRLEGLAQVDMSAGNPMIYDNVDAFLEAYQGDFVLEYDSVMQLFVKRWNDVFMQIKFVINHNNHETNKS